MVDVAPQRFGGRLPQRKGSAFAEFTLPDGQNTVATVQVADIKCEGLADPQAGGVQQAEQRCGRRRSQAVHRRQPARSCQNASYLRDGEDARLPLAPLCRRLGRACGQRFDAGIMAQGVGHGGPHNSDDIVPSPG